LIAVFGFHIEMWPKITFAYANKLQLSGINIPGVRF